MGPFDFYFSFFSLVLGLGVAALAAGMTKALKRRKTIRIGLLTPLLAIFIMLDVASFWVQAWSAFKPVVIGYGTIFLGLTIALSYYFAASLVTPDDFDASPDLDAYYLQNRRLVVAGILFSNAAFITYRYALLGQLPGSNLLSWVLNVAYFGQLIGMLFARGRLTNALLISGNILIYVVSGFFY